MVIGQDVITVQRVSRYCLEGGAEVFPYYGVPTPEEVSLFNPTVSVLCIPLPKYFLCSLNQRYILWSEQPMLIDLPLASTKRELENFLQLALH